MAIEIKLRPYQVEAGRAVLESVLQRQGLTFTVEVSRQGGKNELSAQLEVLLLTLFMARGGNAIKCAPTFRPQLINSILRLKERLGQAGYTDFWVPEFGYILRLGRARQLFLSADGGSRVVGATAHILLEVDEAQEVTPEKYYKEFRPMGASTNVTTVLYGTPWAEASLLEQVKQENLELERKDGVRRHFRYPWEEVAKYNPAYRGFVEGERERLGEGHPLFQTQYCLNPLPGEGRLLTPQERALLEGGHPRRHTPEEGAIYVAGLDLAGGGGGMGQDASVLTIGELDFSSRDPLSGEPLIRVVEHCSWQGEPPSTLYPRLVEVLKNLWGCRRVVVDATGLGAGVASFLEKSLGSGVVKPFVFTTQSKSRLGLDLLSAVLSGRVKMYAREGSEEARQFWLQIEKARRSLRLDRTMNFFVDPREGHDDYLVSLALLVEASRYSPRTARGSLKEAA